MPLRSEPAVVEIRKPRWSQRRLISFATFAILIASVAWAHLRSRDDWASFNHHHFPVINAIDGDSLRIAIGDGRTADVELLGIVAPSEAPDSAAMKFLNASAQGHEATLLLPTPQTRDGRGRLLAYAFVDGSNLSVDLARAGLVYADRRQTDVMSGLIDPAEAEARKKKRGLWQDLKFNRMPAWRQTWLHHLWQQTGK